VPLALAIVPQVLPGDANDDEITRELEAEGRIRQLAGDHAPRVLLGRERIGIAVIPRKTRAGTDSEQPEALAEFAAPLVELLAE
jgi:hypothetical protein